MCTIGKRVTRIYVRGGRPVQAHVAGGRERGVGDQAADHFRMRAQAVAAARRALSACASFLIVLDGVGIGALPDAARLRRRGQPHAAARRRARRRPRASRRSSGSGSGGSCPLPGVRRASSPSGARGRLAERSPGKDSTTGHWELAGHRARAAVPDLSARASRASCSIASSSASAADGWATWSASGTGDHRATRRGASADRTTHRVHFGRQRVPDRGARADGSARRAVSPRARSRGAADR